MKFQDFLRNEVGCEVDVIQEDDGSGYEVLEVRTASKEKWEVTVTTND